jgi:hypothetical protein
VKFTYDEILDLYVSEATLFGRKVKVRLYCSDDANFSALAGKALNDVESQWDPLKKAIVAELYPHYSEQADQGHSADEFFLRLSLKTIDFDTVDIMYTLFWSDGGLFGGHSIQVLWDPDVHFHAEVSLVGGQHLWQTVSVLRGL